MKAYKLLFLNSIKITLPMDRLRKHRQSGVQCRQLLLKNNDDNILKRIDLYKKSYTFYLPIKESESVTCFFMRETSGFCFWFWLYCGGLWSWTCWLKKQNKTIFIFLCSKIKSCKSFMKKYNNLIRGYHIFYLDNKNPLKPNVWI